MLKISAALAATLVAGALLAGSSSAQAAPRLSCESTYGQIAVAGQSAGWQVIESTAASETGTFIGVSVVTGPSNLWVFPGCNEALHYHNGQWREAPMPGGTAANVTAATASSASDVWAFSGGSVLFWNGHTWAAAGRLSGFTSGGLSFAAASGPDSVWFSNGNSLWHFNGQAWSRSALPFASMDTLSAAPDGSLWAAGMVKSTPVVAHFSGGSWKLTSVRGFLGADPYLCGGYAMTIYAQGADNVWAAGGPGCQDRGGSLDAVMHWNGSSWTALSYHGSGGETDSIAPDGSGGIWISTIVGLPGSGIMLHLTHGSIVRSALPEIDGSSPRVSLETAPGGGSVYGVGAYFGFPHGMTTAGSVIIEPR
jgi:hypothetical protein